jgi:CRISPR system Cascade subunit CasB
VWSVVFEDWPTELRPRSDAPTDDERAAQAALTLYAIHQQSKRTKRMHQNGRSLGLAVGQLGRATASSEAVRRRFDALTTAQSITEVLHHGRGLVTQLRGAEIPLDYGMLARHLVQLQRPDLADRARLRWARDYYRRGAGTDSSAEETHDNDSTEGESE